MLVELDIIYIRPAFVHLRGDLVDCKSTPLKAMSAL